MTVLNTLERPVVLIKSHDFYGSNFVRLLESLEYERWVVLEKADHAVNVRMTRKGIFNVGFGLGPVKLIGQSSENDESIAFDDSRRIIAAIFTTAPEKEEEVEIQPKRLRRKRIFEALKSLESS